MLSTRTSDVEPGSDTFTGSVKVIVILASRGALKPFLRGSVLRTNGPNSTIGAVWRGFGVPVTKSLPLLLVSMLPPPRRKIEVLLLGAGAGAAHLPGSQDFRSRQNPSARDRQADNCRPVHRSYLRGQPFHWSHSCLLDRLFELAVARSQQLLPIPTRSNSIHPDQSVPQRLFTKIPTVSVLRCVLNRPAGRINRRSAAVVQFYEIVLISCARVAPTAIYLADQDRTRCSAVVSADSCSPHRDWGHPGNTSRCYVLRRSRWDNAR